MELAASGSDFEVLYDLYRLAYSDKIDESEQLKIWRSDAEWPRHSRIENALSVAINVVAYCCCLGNRLETPLYSLHKLFQRHTVDSKMITDIWNLDACVTTPF